MDFDMVFSLWKHKAALISALFLAKTSENQLVSNDRGYGFATVEDDPYEEEYFIHYSAISMDGYKTLKAKQPITFVLTDTDKGTQATEIEIV